MQKLFQLAYSSLAAPELDVLTLEGIMDSAIKYNSSKQITGSLILYDGILFQILEGAEDEVMILLEKIKRDTRHSRLQITWTTAIEERSFDRWSMRYIEYENLSPEEQNFLKQIPQTAHGHRPDFEVLKILAEAE